MKSWDGLGNIYMIAYWQDFWLLVFKVGTIITLGVKNKILEILFTFTLIVIISYFKV